MVTVTLGVVHPGEMGSAVGAAARAGGARVVWASVGRGDATRARAQAEALEDVGTLARLANESAVIVSVCPPAAALDVARGIARLPFRGTFVDANAIAPQTTRQVGEVITAAGATFVDGGIIGPPPRRAGTTRLYVSGRRARDVATLFEGTLLGSVVIDGPVGAASAVKMAYAGWNKGSQALLMAVRALAAHEGVDEALLAEWAQSAPDLAQRSAQAVAGTSRKAWRFVGEMHEIAATFAAAGMPEGFHEAAAEIYERLASWKDAPAPPSVVEALKSLAR
jgi:3-hydroxyisobutyrate dehydrogenase-like beta-hydroxyacid dehydrogenase